MSNDLAPIGLKLNVKLFHVLYFVFQAKLMLLVRLYIGGNENWRIRNSVFSSTLTFNNQDKQSADDMNISLATSLISSKIDPSFNDSKILKKRKGVFLKGLKG